MRVKVGRGARWLVAESPKEGPRQEVKWPRMENTDRQAGKTVPGGGRRNSRCHTHPPPAPQHWPLTCDSL